MRPQTIRSRRVVTPTGVGPASVVLSEGRVTAVTAYDARTATPRDTDLGEVALLPGMVDLGVLVQRPDGPLRAGYEETTRAAARGGVTTLVVTPAPAEPSILTRAALRAHLRASLHCWTHVAHLGGVTAGSASADLAELRAAGVVGLYASLAGGSAPHLGPLDDTQLRKTMAEAAAMGIPLLVRTGNAAETAGPEDDPAVLPAARPRQAERRGLERVIAAARMTGAHGHVTPFTAAECAAMLAAARTIGVRVSAQTCPHHLLPPAGPGAESGGRRCRFPPRSDTNRLALGRALLDDATGDAAGTISVGSGHRPGTGSSGTIEWTLPALWTVARDHGGDLADMARWVAGRPARVVGLAAKGAIRPGGDADLVAFDPDASQRVPQEGPASHAGRRLRGRVVATWVAGRAVFDIREGGLSGAPPPSTVRAGEH